MKRLIFLVLFIISSLSANEYFVSPTGSDTGPGTFEQPFATISKAASLLQAGDVCTIRGGVYRETITPASSGAEGAPILFQHYAEEEVFITGTEPVLNWQPEAGMIWKAAVTSPVTQVFINGAHAEKARYPNSGYTPFDVDSWADVELFADKRGAMTGISSLGGVKNARVVALGASRWVTVTGVIGSQSGESFSVTKVSKQWSAEAPAIYLGMGKGYLVDHKNLLDAANEWFCENGVLYFIPPEGSDPNTLTVEARVRQKGADLDGKSYIHISGLNFKAANVTLRNSIGCVIDRCTIRYPVPFFTFSNGFNRDATTPNSWEGNGVEVSGSMNVIRNCCIAHSWGDGVTMWGSGNTLENCLIEDCDWMAVDSAPLSVTGSDHIIRQNSLRMAARSILVHRYLGASDIIYNDLHDCGLMCDDLGLTYSFQSDGKGTIIAYNWVHDNQALHTGPGIYLDNGDSNYLVHHNVIWNCGEGIRLNLPQTNTDVFNNTMWNNKNSMGAWGPDGTSMTDVRTWNNIQDQQMFQGSDLSNNLYSRDDMFIDAANGDFRLKEGASAIDFGKIIPGITDGYTGSTADAGAYEFGGADWHAGSSVQPPVFSDSPPTAPDGLRGEVLGIGKIRLRWIDRSTNETGFAIDRKQGDTVFLQIGAVSENTSEFVDSTVVTLTSYIYRVRAFNLAGSAPTLRALTITSASDGSALRLQAEAYDQMSGITNFGTGIGSCDNGDYVMFKAVDFGEGFDLFTTSVTVPAEYAGSSVIIKIDKRNGATIGKLKVAATGGWDNYIEQSTTLERIAGVHDVYFLFSGGSGVGNFDWLQFVRTVSGVTGVTSPLVFQLAQNYPNPFNLVTRIQYDLPAQAQVTLDIFDALGRLVRKLTDEQQATGSYETIWNGCDDRGLQVASGVYFYRLRAKSATRTYEQSLKMLMIK